MSNLYPLKFTPIFKKTLWGGNKLRAYLSKASEDGTGESWEISALQGNESIVKEGNLAGKSLKDLCAQFGAELLGEKVVHETGKEFPLLFKFIDARQDLSLQVHPNNELAQKKHHCFGKTEMWYVVQADEGARLINGFCQELKPDQYEAAVKSGEILDFVGSYEVKEGDTFFIPAGRIHGIGAGILIAEIQQTSNITYRLYDYHRKDQNGQERQLHIADGKDALDFAVLPNTKISVEEQINQPETLVQCPFFTVNLLHVEGTLTRDLVNRKSFVAYMALQGKTTISVQEKLYSIEKGESILIPAALASYCVQGINAKLLEVYI